MLWVLLLMYSYVDGIQGVMRVYADILGDERKSNSEQKTFYEDMHFKDSFGHEVNF